MEQMYFTTRVTSIFKSKLSTKHKGKSEHAQTIKIIFKT
jgi:hypothetical protein